MQIDRSADKGKNKNSNSRQFKFILGPLEPEEFDNGNKICDSKDFFPKQLGS